MNYAEKLLDRCWRLEHLYRVINEQGNKVDFKLRPAQRLLIVEMHYYNLVLKARQLGFTTLIDLLALDMALFTPNFQVVIIAHKLDDAAKIFREKIKGVYDALPKEIKMLNPAIKCDAGELILKNGSVIRVTTSARSGTCQFLHISEYGKICARFLDKAREIKTGSLPAVHENGFIFIESTAEGNSGHFYDLCQDANKAALQKRKLMKQEFKFHFFPWHQNPEYRVSGKVAMSERLLKYFDSLALEHDIELDEEQMNWYAMTEKNLGEDMHREFPSYPNEAFRVAQEGTYYKREFERIYRENRICNLPVEPHLLVYTAWDLGISDDSAIWFIQANGRELRVVDYYENNGEGLGHYANILQEKGYRYGGHFAPHDIEVRELGTGVTRVETAAKHGIRFQTVPTNIDLIGGIEQTRQLLNDCYFDERRTEAGVKCLEGYRKEWDEKHGIFKAKPCHDWTSHGADALRTFAVAKNLGMVVTGQQSRRSMPNKASNDGWSL
jgi:hypothetical protein